MKEQLIRCLVEVGQCLASVVAGNVGYIARLGRVRVQQGFNSSFCHGVFFVLLKRIH